MVVPAILAAVASGWGVGVGPAAAASPGASPKFAALGGLDCNGYSSIQRPVKPHQTCADFKGYDGARGFDNGHYVGHDEPSVQFVSNAHGSGNNVQWRITLPKERPLPAYQTFENSIAYWFSMALCDPNSYPQHGCIPNSDKNIAQPFDNPNTAGSAFLEMQFYPPGFSPFISKISCDRTHWCASLHINSLECSDNFSYCNPKCTETTNFAFIQSNGVPTGPAGPANQTAASFTPNRNTLLMNGGDTLTITIKDTPHGVLNRIQDGTTGRSGFMVASAANGFQSLKLHTCAPVPLDFRPEFDTAKFGNFVPWAALQANVGFADELGHFTPGLHGDGDTEDPPCFGGPTLPGCLNFAQGGDIDFDGTSYLPTYPNGTSSTATPLHISSASGSGFGPVSAPHGTSRYVTGYPALQFESDVSASESTCKPTGVGCTVPPAGAEFYPFFAQSSIHGRCSITFGDDVRGSTINDFHRTVQYGPPNLAWFYGQNSGGLRPNPCRPS